MLVLSMLSSPSVVGAAPPRFTVVETRPVTNYTLSRIPGVVETFSAELELIGNASRSIDLLAMYCEVHESTPPPPCARAPWEE